MGDTLSATAPMMSAGLARPKRRLRATSVSIVLHVGAVAALSWVVHPHRLLQSAPPPSFALPSFALVMEPPQPIAPTLQDLAAKPILQAAQTQPAQLATPASLSLNAVEHAELHRSRMPNLRRPAAIQQSEPTQPAAKPASAAPSQPAATAASAIVSADVLSQLHAKIHQAVQEATLYPPAARLMRREGRAQIRFAYANGEANNISLAQSSDSATLDEAALSAVRRASMPRPPPEIGAKKLDLLVWVDFSLVRQN